MDEDRDRIRVTRVQQGSGGLPAIVALMVIAAVVVSVWQPWESSGQGTPAASDDASLPAAVVPSRVRTPAPVVVPSATTRPIPSLHPDAVACTSRAGWRIVTVERTAGRESRSWIAVKPVAATSPTDRAVPLVREVSGVTRALGYCLPGELAFTTDPGDLHARVWRLEAGGRAVEVGALSRVAEPTVDSSDLYLAEGAKGIETSRWAAGRYVFQVTDPTAGWEVWFGIDLARASGPPEP